uniref:Uncharacterized protein n=1 Tax=Rhizobium leguminosarum TaxID=384 RepID=A0A154IP33_RHILE|nr:hypothetical protein A4A59_10400 [Rhizobium leguminosarum]
MVPTALILTSSSTSQCSPADRWYGENTSQKAQAAVADADDGLMRGVTVLTCRSDTAVGSALEANDVFLFAVDV